MIHELRWQQRLNDFEKAAKKLENALDKKTFAELEKDGVIQRFEFSFELAWKTLKDYLEEQGFTGIDSPKKTIQKAFQAQLFQDHKHWIQMLDDRNKMFHLYDQKTSDQIFKNIKKDYSKLMRDLISTLKKEQTRTK